MNDSFTQFHASSSEWVRVQDGMPTPADADLDGNVEVIRENGKRELVTWEAVGFDPDFHLAASRGARFMWWRPFHGPEI